MDTTELAVLFGNNIPHSVITAFGAVILVGIVSGLWLRARLVHDGLHRNAFRVGLVVLAGAGAFILSQDARVRLAGGMLATHSEVADYYLTYVNAGRFWTFKCLGEAGRAAGSSYPHGAEYTRCDIDAQMAPLQAEVGAWLKAHSPDAAGEGTARNQATDVIRAGYLIGDSPEFVGRLIAAGYSLSTKVQQRLAGANAHS